MSRQLGDRDGRLLEMTRRRGLGRCEEVVRSVLTQEKPKMLRYNIWSGRPICSVLASGEIPKDVL